MTKAVAATPEPTPPIPVLQSTGSALYALMLSQSTQEIIAGIDPIAVWRGKIVKTCEAVGIPYGSYRKTVLALESIGAIQLVQRGTRGSPTVIALLQSPTEELWATYDGSRGVGLTRASEAATMQAQVQVLLDQLGGIDIGEAIRNLDTRLKALESKVDERKS